MKNAKQLMDHITNLPQFKPLRDIQTMQLFLRCLTPSMRAMISVVYAHRGVLHIVVPSPSYKAELQYKCNFIKSILKQIQATHKILLSVQSITIRYQEMPRSKTKFNPTPKTLHFKEMAKGTFVNPCADPKLHQSLEDLRNHIIKIAS